MNSDRVFSGRLLWSRFQGHKPGMQILRPPPGSGGSEGTEDVAPSKNRFLQVLVAVLFLVIGMVIFFVGGVIVRNPELPNYLLDQVVTRFRGTKGNQNTGIERTGAGAGNVTPPPSPTTAEEYLNLMSYDENVLSTDERAIVSILNQMVPSVLVGSPPAWRFNQEIVPEIESLKPGDEVTRIRATLQECRDLASSYVRRCHDGAIELEGKLTAAGLAPAMAHEVAEAFARRPLTNGTVYWPDEFNKACDDAATLIDILSKDSSKWKRDEGGHPLFASEALADQYNAASKDLNAALRAATYGTGNILPRPPTTVDDYLNLTNYDEKTLPPGEQVVASVLNQTTSQVSNTGISRWSSHLAELYNDQIIPGFKALKPGGDDTKVRSAIAECREKANETIQFYQELPEQLATKLIAAGVPGSVAHKTAESFAERASARRNVSWAVNVNLTCNCVAKLMDLLSKNPSKWKRNAEGKVLFISPGLVEQFNIASQDLNSAIKALNGG